MDDEIIGMCCKALKGIDVDAEHLALEVMDEVGPGGTFMTTAHTLDHMRKEYFMGSGITNSKSRDQWESEGAKDTRERAREIVRAILKNEEKFYIPESVDNAIRDKYVIRLPKGSDF
jgi:trimethylamine--corrinoid protein Co-methyltransferase